MLLPSLILRQTLLTLVFQALLCLVASAQADDSPGQMQRWTSANGQSIVAKMQRVENEKVHLFCEDRLVRKVPLRQLDTASQSKAMAIHFDRCDSEQFRMVRQHLNSLQERPEATSLILKQLHQQIPESPYAGLWAAVGYSAGTNDLTIAKSMISQTIQRIEEQQKYLPTRHRTTLASALNNYAIISMKEVGSAACAGRLTSALQATDIAPPMVRHNAEQLLNLNEADSPRFALSLNQRRRLAETIAMSEVNTTTAKHPAGWFYNLDVDVPGDRLGAAIRVDGVDSPHPSLELVSMATGLTVAPGLVLTTRGAVRANAGPAVLALTVGTLQSGQLKSLRVKTCMRTRPTVSVRAASLLRGLGRDVLFTRFSYFTPPIHSLEGQLVGLHVPGLDLRPAVVVRETPATGTEGSVVGYRRGTNLAQKGLIRVSGEVTGQPQSSGEQSGSFDITGGQIGAPLIDHQNHVRAMVFDLPSNATQAGCRMFGGRVIHSWFAKNVPATSLAQQGDRPFTQRDLERAIVPVFGWGLKQTMTAFGQMSDGLAASESLMIRDAWCMHCGGTGHYDCVDCAGGTVAVHRRKQVAYSPIGGPIYGKVVKKKRCPSCNGKAVHDCRACRDGRY